MAYPKGTYECEIIAQGFGESKEKKTPYFYLEFIPKGLISDDGYLEEVKDNYSRNIKFWMTPAAVPYAIERLRTLGWTGKSFRDFDGDDPVFTFVGTKLDLVCTNRTEGGKTYDDFEFPGGTGDGKPQLKSEKGLAQKLDKLFGSELKKGSAKPESAKAAPVMQGDGSDVEDETIPF